MVHRLLQFECTNCSRAYSCKERLRVHKTECQMCPKCNDWADKRHLARCTGPKRNRGPRVVCPLCKRLRSKQFLWKHFKDKHGETKFTVNVETLQTEVS